MLKESYVVYHDDKRLKHCVDNYYGVKLKRLYENNFGCKSNAGMICR